MLARYFGRQFGAVANWRGDRLVSLSIGTVTRRRSGAFYQMSGETRHIPLARVLAALEARRRAGGISERGYRQRVDTALLVELGGEP